jgi:carbon-monoxide dehydrogenase large subunit
MGRFGLSQPVPRGEDHRFLTGAGRYTADIDLPGQVHVVMLRSMHAHADIRGIDASEAAAMPGVLAVATAQDLARDGLGDLRCAIPVKDSAGQPLPSPGRRLLARERVRFVGEPVAMIVAETLAQTRDAAENLVIDYAPLPAVVEIEDAIAADAPVRIWAGADGNVAFFWERGEEANVENALENAAHVVRLKLVNNRVVPCPMEPRAAIGLYDAVEDRYTLYTSSQGGHPIKETLSRCTLKVPADRLRVIVPDVGGGFGSKIYHYPEEALVLWAARRLGRPVKWVADRSEAFIGDTHGRDQRNAVAAAFDADGRILALRVDTLANMGAYLNEFAPAIPSQATGCMVSGAYAIPAIYATCRGVYTNTVPIDAYRGAGRPEATYLLERLMDAAARQLGLPPDEIRRRNFIRPEQMPYRTACGPTYDSGDFARNLKDALAAADWTGFEARRSEARARGKLRGRGLSCYVEICGFDEEEATLRCTGDGAVELLIGTQSTGQGHETAYAQIVADDLGVPFESVRVVQGDTDLIPFGRGTSGSRSLPVGGPAIRAACAALIARGEELARSFLQQPTGPVRFASGIFLFGEGKDIRRIGLLELARALAEPENQPAADRWPMLEAAARYKIKAPTFPNGTHVCEVEIDPDTGVIQVARYHVVDDFGTIVNPLLLAGQVQGGIAQGIGQALLERTVYDPQSGQLLTGSFVDYGLPRAHDIPPIDIQFNSIRCVTNPLGIKGAGEAGAIGACPAVVNAAIDALAPLGITHVDMPLTPETIWRAIVAAESASPRELDH